MISATNSSVQEIEQYETIILSECKSISCSAQLKDSTIVVTFPGVYAIQWSLTCKLKTSGKISVQAYNGSQPIQASFASDKSPSGILKTLSTAPVVLVFKNPCDKIEISLKNTGGALSISNVILSVTKLF